MRRTDRGTAPGSSKGLAGTPGSHGIMDPPCGGVASFFTRENEPTNERERPLQGRGRGRTRAQYVACRLGPRSIRRSITRPSARARPPTTTTSSVLFRTRPRLSLSLSRARARGPANTRPRPPRSLRTDPPTDRSHRCRAWSPAPARTSVASIGVRVRGGAGRPRRDRQSEQLQLPRSAFIRQGTYVHVNRNPVRPSVRLRARRGTQHSSATEDLSTRTGHGRCRCRWLAPPHAMQCNLHCQLGVQA